MTARTAIRILLATGLLAGARGACVHGADQPPFSVRMQQATSPEAQRLAWMNRGRVILGEWAPRIRILLGDNSPDAGLHLVLESGHMDRPACVVREKGKKPVMKVSADWITRNPAGKGLLVHELTHVIQDYPAPAQDASKPSWIVEGIADWIRFFNFEKPVGIPTPTPGCHLNGYREAADFLNWANKRYPGLIRSLHLRLKKGTYNDDCFQELTGKPLDILQLEHVKAQAPKSETRSAGTRMGS